MRDFPSLGLPLVMLETRNECHLIVNTMSDIIPLGDVAYFHFLPAALYNGTGYHNDLKTFRRLMTRPYAALYHNLISKISEQFMLTNGSYTRDAMCSYIGKTPRIVFPPVDVSPFEAVRNELARERSVVTCGRFSPEKNYEFVLETARVLPSIRFVIAGVVTGSNSHRYYQKIKSAKEELKLSNVELMPNQSSASLLHQFALSRVLFSTMIGEPFGISVVEGMAAGLVPVVHKSGGPWLDSLSGVNAVNGYSYVDIEGAVSRISHVMNDEVSTNRIRENNVNRARAFSDSSFKKTITDVTNDAIRIKWSR